MPPNSVSYCRAEPSSIYAFVLPKSTVHGVVCVLCEAASLGYSGPRAPPSSGCPHVDTARRTSARARTQPEQRPVSVPSRRTPELLRPMPKFLLAISISAFVNAGPMDLSCAVFRCRSHSGAQRRRPGRCWSVHAACLLNTCCHAALARWWHWTLDQRFTANTGFQHPVIFHKPPGRCLDGVAPCRR